MPIIQGSIDVSSLNVEIRHWDGVVSVSTASDGDDDDPYGIELDLTPAAARGLAGQLRAAADACDSAK